jgi:hypothetical protein
MSLFLQENENVLILDLLEIYSMNMGFLHDDEL